MPASQPASFNLQEFTDNGQLLVAGRLYTYAYGTTAQKTAYTDPDGTVPHTYTLDSAGGQYIALNARGELPAPLYLVDGSYDISLKRADGSTVWTRKADGVENSVKAWISSLATSVGASLIGFIQAGVGAVKRVVQDKLSETISTFDYLTPSQIADVQAGRATDLTAQLQKAINAAAGKRLIVNSGKYGLSFVGWGTFGMALDVPSNITIEFEPGASFEALAHNATIYQMLRIWDRDNVTLIRPTLNGRKDLNAAVTGESGMAIDVRGGTNITIVQPTTLNCWGDGIYWGYSANTGNPKNAYILKHHADGCRRQGMSVIAADGLVIDTPLWENIGGTAPGAGIDIEPDDNNSELKGIRILNPTTRNNVTGISVYLGKFAGAVAKTVDIEVIGHRDDGCKNALAVGGANTNGGAYTLGGMIAVIDPVWVNSGEVASKVFEHDALGPAVNVVRPIVVNSNRTAQAAQKYGAPFVVLRDTGSALTYPMGNVKILEPSIRITSGSIPAPFLFQDAVNGASGITNCHFIDPLNLIGVANLPAVFRGKGTISDKYRVWVRDSVGSETLNDFVIGPISAPNASVAYTLSNVLFYAGGPDIIINAKFATSCIVQTEAGGNFVGMTAGQRLQAFGAAGSYLRLRPLGAGIFLPVEKAGAWNVI